MCWQDLKHLHNQWVLLKILENVPSNSCHIHPYYRWKTLYLLMVWPKLHMKANRESSQISATVATAEYRITSYPKTVVLKEVHRYSLDRTAVAPLPQTESQAAIVNVPLRCHIPARRCIRSWGREAPSKELRVATDYIPFIQSITEIFKFFVHLNWKLCSDLLFSLTVIFLECFLRVKGLRG